MNNTINNVSNISFNSRYINVSNLEKLPPRISRAILRSPAIDEFLKAGKPKTLWDKFLDMFKKDEILEIYHNVSKDQNSTDPHALEEFVCFIFEDKKHKTRIFPIRKFQNGVERKPGSVPKPGEHFLYKAPQVTSEEEIAREIEKLENLDKLLK